MRANGAVAVDFFAEDMCVASPSSSNVTLFTQLGDTYMRQEWVLNDNSSTMSADTLSAPVLRPFVAAGELIVRGATLLLCGPLCRPLQ
jgi:hypothetical protein